MLRTSHGLIAVSARTGAIPRVRRPTRLADVLAILADEDEPPTLICGGTDLCAQINEGLAPASLLALDRVGALEGVRREGASLVVGAATRHETGMADPLLLAALPGLARAWGRIANLRVRGWGTIGGNLMARRTRYEMSVILAALGAELRFLAPGGARFTRSPNELWTLGVPARALLHEIALQLRPGAVLRYDRALRPTMTLALHRDEAGATAAIATESLRPVRLAVEASNPAEAAEAAFAALPDDFCDPAASRWYLQRAGTALLRRALEAPRAVH